MGVSSSFPMTSDRKQVKVTLPDELHRKLKVISDRTGIPMAQMFLQATVEKYKDELKELERRE